MSQTGMHIPLQKEVDVLEIPQWISRQIFSSVPEKRNVGLKDLENFFKTHLESHADDFDLLVKAFKTCYPDKDFSNSTKRAVFAGINVLLNLFGKVQNPKAASISLMVDMLISLHKDSQSQDLKLTSEINGTLDKFLKSNMELVLECFSDLFLHLIWMLSNNQEINIVTCFDDTLKDLVSQAYNQGLMSLINIDLLYAAIEKSLTMTTSQQAKNIIINWIQFIDLKAEKKVLYEFDRLAQGVFPMLNEQNKDIVFSAEQLIKNLSNEFDKKLVTMDNQAVTNLMISIIAQAQLPGDRSKQLTLEWILTYLEKCLTLHRDASNHSNNSKEICLIELPYTLFAKLIKTILINIQSEIEAISDRSSKCNDVLLILFDQYAKSELTNFSDLDKVLKDYFSLFKNEELSLSIALTWTRKIAQKFQNEMIEKLDFYLGLTKINNEKVFDIIIDLLCDIMKYQECFEEKVICKLLEKMSEMNKLLEKTHIIIKKLCSKLTAKKAFLLISKVLLDMKVNLVIKEKDDFATQIITNLDTFLLMSVEAEPLREEFRKPDKDNIYFKQLFPTWCLNPVSALTLCILSKNFELAFNLILKL